MQGVDIELPNCVHMIATRLINCVPIVVTTHVETVVSLSLKKDTPKIEVVMEPNGESNYTPEEKATYQKIKQYVKDKYGVNVHTRLLFTAD